MESEWATVYPHPNHPISIRKSRTGFKLNLRIGEGRRCRRARLSTAEIRKVADALLSAAEGLDKQLDRLRSKARRSQ
jgi:hypothetical protein